MASGATITSTAHVIVNSLVFVESLPDSEHHTGRYLEEDLAAELDLSKVHHEYHAVTSPDELLAVLSDLRDRAKHGLRPILHIDTHGSQDGLHLVGGLVRWNEVVAACRAINRETANNLVACFSACYGLRAILEGNITELTPFFAVVGPEATITGGELETEFAAFYRTVFSSGDMVTAAANLSSMKVYYAEKALTISYARYVREGCMGVGKRTRVERLVTDYRTAQPTGSIRTARRAIKKMIKPTVGQFERYKRRFLMSDHPANAGRFTIRLADVLRLVRPAQGRGTHRRR